jgi:uroporphyrinogen-III synthase
MPTMAGDLVLPCAHVPPLGGHTVALTGHRRSDELAAHLEREGATVLRGPLVHTHVVEDPSALQTATRAVIERPPQFLVATTGIGMRSWFHAAASSGEVELLLGALRDTRVLARGPKVVGAVSEVGLHPWFVEPSGRTAPLVELLERQPIDGAHIVFQLPGAPLTLERARLVDAGAVVTDVAPYERSWPDDLTSARRVLRAIADRHVSVVTFTSRSAVEHLQSLARSEGIGTEVENALRGAVGVVCVGEVTAATFVERFGVEPVRPDRPLLGAIVQAAVSALRHEHHHIESAGASIVVQRRLASGGGTSVLMSDREADVLRCLLVAQRTVLREELLVAVWGSGVVDPSVVDTTIARLRRRLARTGLAIRTVNGRGYLLDGHLMPCSCVPTGTPRG